MMPENLENYMLQHTSEEDPLLYDLYRETNLKMVYPRMLSGHYQGKLLEMISNMINPGFILEIGTFTGYSAICLAKGLKTGGKLYTIEIDPEVADFAAKYFRRAGLEGTIIQKTGNAGEIIPLLDPEWDLVFIDADKEEYVNYYQQVFSRVKVGGFILADNVFWDGKVLEPEESQDKETKGITAFNAFVRADVRVQKLMLPVRDGIMILQKIRN